MNTSVRVCIYLCPGSVVFLGGGGVNHLLLNRHHIHRRFRLTVACLCRDFVWSALDSRCI